MAQKAIQFGAGNIGRGFIGQLLYHSGYETTFVDVVQEVIDDINQRGTYPVRVVSNEGRTTDWIENVSAVHSSDEEAVARAIAEADLGATAVGVPVLPKIAPVLARGLAHRFQNADAAPLNFIVCENMIGAGPFLREKVRAHLPAEHQGHLDEKVGFVEASIGRMVPIMTAEQKAEDPLLVCVEPYSELPVDKSGFKGSIPDVQNMKPLDKFGAYVERKLFVHNMSHATAAYFGFLKGHEYIWQAITDPDVRAEVEAALKETCAGMVSKHGLDGAALRAHGEDLMERYANRALGDQVARIGKDPVRKLGPQDRLLGSARMCMEQDVKPVHVARSAAAGMHFNPPGDPTAERVQEIRRARGIQGVCEEICGLNGREPLTRLIEQADKNLKDEGWFR